MFRTQHPAEFRESVRAASETVRVRETAVQAEFFPETDRADSAAVRESPVDSGRCMDFPFASNIFCNS